MCKWNFSGKTEADNLMQIGITWLKENGYLVGWKSGNIKWASGFSENESNIGITVSVLEDNSFVQLNYVQTKHNEKQKNFNYRIDLETTPCKYGGRRYWFICPVSKGGKPCNRRVGILYKHGDYFACRHCYNLTYRKRKYNRHHNYYPMFHTLDLLERSNKMQSKIKRCSYNGKQTKKYVRLYKIRKKIAMSNNLLQRSNLI